MSIADKLHKAAVRNPLAPHCSLQTPPLHLHLLHLLLTVAAPCTHRNCVAGACSCWWLSNPRRSCQLAHLTSLISLLRTLVTRCIAGGPFVEPGQQSAVPPPGVCIVSRRRCHVPHSSFSSIVQKNNEAREAAAAAAAAAPGIEQPAK